MGWARVSASFVGGKGLCAEDEEESCGGMDEDCGATWICPNTSNKAVAVQTEKDADDPRPAPTGRLARAVRVSAGL